MGPGGPSNQSNISGPSALTVAVWAALADLDVHLASFTPGQLAARKFVVLPVSIPQPGTLSITIVIVPPAVSARTAASEHTLLARAIATLRTAGPNRIKLRLSRGGRARLHNASKHRSKVHLHLALALSPADHTPTVRAARIANLGSHKR